MIYNKIELLLNVKKFKLKDLVDALGITRSGYYYMVENKTMTVDRLEKISEFFNVPVGYWFDDDAAILNEPLSQYNANRIKELKQETEFLKDEIKFLRDQVNRSQENCDTKDKKNGLRLVYSNIKC